MQEDDASPGRTGLRFFFIDRNGELCPLSKREWMVLYDELEYRRLRNSGHEGGSPPPHTRNPAFAGRIVIVFEVYVALNNRHPARVLSLRGFRHLFDDDGRLNLDHAELHLRGAVGRRVPEALKARPTAEQAALIRTHLYRWKHAGRRPSGPSS